MCFPIGYNFKDFTNTSDLSVLSKSLATSQLESLLFHSVLTNLTSISLINSTVSCELRMKNNLSDFSVGNFFPHDDATYSVPVPFIPVTLDFVAGYDHGKYIEQQTNLAGTFLGVLENLYSFEIEVYVVIAAFWVTFGFIILCQFHLIQDERNNKLKRRRIKKQITFARYFNSIINDALNDPSNSRTRMTCFLFSLFTFFSFTPFTLMFKTTQVVTESPKIITNYREIIESGAEVLYTNLNSDETEFLKPSETSIKNNDLVNQMWNYFVKKATLFKAKGRIDIINLRNERTYSLANRTLVFFATRHFAKYLREVHCSWTDDQTLLRMFRFHDPSQREILGGFAFRLGFTDERLIKRLKIIFEHRLSWAMKSRNLKLLGFKKKFVNNKATTVYQTSKQHRSEQLDLCLDQSLLKYEKEETFASNTSFFTCFFIILFLLLICSMIILVYEIYYG